MIKLKNYVDSGTQKDEFDVDDFDNPDGWNWKEVDHLLEMGFNYEGNTRFKLCDKKEYDETLNVEIYKEKSSGAYIMILNGRKHVFSNFSSMLAMIDEMGSTLGK